MGGPITVEGFKCCDWSVHNLIEVNFSKLTDSNIIFTIDFVSIHYHIGEIIECKIFWWVAKIPRGEAVDKCRVMWDWRLECLVVRLWVSTGSTLGNYQPGLLGCGREVLREGK